MGNIEKTIELADCSKCMRLNSVTDEHCKGCGGFLAPKIHTPKGWIPSLEGERHLATVVGGFRDLSPFLLVSLIRHILGHSFVYFSTTKRVFVVGKKTKDFALHMIQIPDIVQVSIAYDFIILRLLRGLLFLWWGFSGCANTVKELADWTGPLIMILPFCLFLLILGLLFIAEGVWAILRFRTFSVEIFTAAGPVKFSVSRMLGEELEDAADELERIVAQIKSSS